MTKNGVNRSARASAEDEAIAVGTVEGSKTKPTKIQMN